MLMFIKSFARSSIGVPSAVWLIVAALLAPPWQAARADDPIDPPVYVCDSVLGTSASPLGHCTNEWENESAAEIMAEEIDAIVFGGGAEGQISYQLDSGQDYAASAPIAGLSERNQAFTFTPLFRNAIKDVPQDTHALTVIGRLEGPTAVPAYIVGLIIHDETLDCAGLVVAGQVSSEVAESLSGGSAQGNGGNPNCAANCQAVLNAALLAATAALGGDTAIAAAAMVSATVVCVRLGAWLGGTGPWGVIAVVGPCIAVALLVYSAAMARTLAHFSAAVNTADAAFATCMAGCGYFPM